MVSVKFSPNNKLIYSSSYVVFKNRAKREIKIWDIETNKEIVNINASSEKILFSPDSKYFFTCEKGTIIQRDAITGEIIKNFESLDTYVSDLVLSLDGKYIIGSTGRTIKQWDIQTGEIISTFGLETKSIHNIKFAPSEDNFGWIQENVINIMNTKTGKVSQTYTCDTSITCMNFSSDSKYIVSGSVDGLIKIWDATTTDSLFSLPTQNGKISAVDFSPDGKDIISLSGSEIKLWSVETRKFREFFSHFNEYNYVSFSPDGKFIASAGNDNRVNIWKLRKKRKPFKSYYVPCPSTYDSHWGYTVNCITFSPDSQYIAWSNNFDKIFLLNNENWNYRTFESNSTVSCIEFSHNGKYFITGSKKSQYRSRCDYNLKLWEISTGKEITTYVSHTNDITSIVFSPDDKFIFSSSKDGSIKIWETNTGKLLVSIINVVNSDDWIAISPDGMFDGTDEGFIYLSFVNGLSIIPLSSLYEQYYTPNLIARILAGEKFEEPEIKIDDLKLPPLVEITSPQSHQKLNNNQLTVNVKITDQGGGIDEIRLYLNDKLIETTQRGFVKVEQNNNVKTKTFIITLTNGENKIKATAFSNQRTESIPNEITVFYEGVKKTANLHMLVIGIDNYKNPKYKLNYAVADATAFKQEVEEGSNEIFGSVNITFISDADATRVRILQEFENLKTNVGQEDVFIFYYAGHGVMSVDDKPEFYIIPYEVTKLYEDNQTLKTTAISSDELLTFSTELKAQKQMFIFDACQSGGINDFVAARGAAEEKAIAQLARSTGTYWLTASNSEQFATEFAELGHGLFTYCILLGLQGQADGGDKDKKITVKELSSFLDDKVPELSEKHKGTPQYPNTYGRGMDFPIIIVK